MHKDIVIASDHAGFYAKEFIKKNFPEINFIDLGTNSTNKSDYPDYAYLVAKYIYENPNIYGVLICGSGIGISIAANRFSHIRAALCINTEYAKLARSHNDANILVIGARFLQNPQITEIMKTFFSTDFEGGRHEKRLEKLTNYPKFNN